MLARHSGKLADDDQFHETAASIFARTARIFERILDIKSQAKAAGGVPIICRKLVGPYA